MGVGSGIALFVVGAILAFAVNIQTTFVSIPLVGYILMGAGALIFLLSLIFMLRRRTSSVTASSSVDPATGNRAEQRVIKSDDPQINP